MINLYVSLDEAREELHKRWQDEELKQAIESELGETFWPQFKDKPRGYIGRHLPSPNNGFIFFLKCSYYVGAFPLSNEYLEDMFVSLNEEKKGLGRLRVWNDNGIRYFFDIVDFNANEKKKINEVVTKTGCKLVDFHHELLDLSKFNVDLKDSSSWISKIGPPKIFYYPYLLHFAAHGVLFETFVTEGGGREMSFTTNIAIPAIKKIERKFGLKPLIVRSEPKSTTPYEDFYWCSYPPVVNQYLIDYAMQNNLRLRELPHLKQQKSGTPATSVSELPSIFKAAKSA